jgi:hypothetical protein
MSYDQPVERANQVVVNDERKPVLYDHKDRPLVRMVGFTTERREEK